MKEIRKTLDFEIAGEEFELDVDWRLGEILEAAFDTGLDQVCAILATLSRVQRRHVAKTFADWIRMRAKTKLKRSEIHQYIVQSPPEVFYTLVGQLLAAALYSQKNMSEEEFDRTMTQLAKANEKPSADPEPESDFDAEDDPEKKP